jgi:CSLREA domain-containing protein
MNKKALYATLLIGILVLAGATDLSVARAGQTLSLSSSRKELPAIGTPEDAIPMVSDSANAPQASIVVNTTEDELDEDEDCSLREAVQAATTNSVVDACPAGDGGLTDTITFSISGTVTLVSSPLSVGGGGPLTIDGGGAITISGGDAVRPFDTDYTAILTIKNVTIIDGYAWEGGGIYNTGDLTVQDSVISGCNTYGNLTGGGGIYNSGTLKVVNSTISGNHALSYGTDTSYGGGIYNSAGTVSLTDSTLSGNDADYGGGIRSLSAVRITNSTLSGNGAWREGGGIYSTVALYLSNATLSNNSAGDRGGGVFTGSQPLYLRNTIVAKNTATDGPDCYVSSVATYGYNLVGSRNGCGLYPRTGDLIGVDPKLGPLQDNGGPTLTHAALPGSLVIDHGNPSGCSDFQGNPLTTDQRGLPRFGRCDIGAHEWQPAVIAEPHEIYLPLVLKSSPTPLFFDDFSRPANGWPVYEDDARRFQYLDQEYRILAKVAPAWIGARPNYQSTRFVVTVDVRNATGTEGYYGILFGLAGDSSHFYFFVVHPTRRYVILRADPDTSYWIADGYSNSIQTGTASNQLKLERNGSMIWAYVNGDLLTIFPDGTYTGLGYLGLIAVADPVPNVDARFDNFTVLPITCGNSYAYPTLAGAIDVQAVEISLPENWESSHHTWDINR